MGREGSGLTGSVPLASLQNEIHHNTNFNWNKNNETTLCILMATLGEGRCAHEFVHSYKQLFFGRWKELPPPTAARFCTADRGLVKDRLLFKPLHHLPVLPCLCSRSRWPQLPPFTSGCIRKSENILSSTDACPVTPPVPCLPHAPAFPVSRAAARELLSNAASGAAEGMCYSAQGYLLIISSFYARNCTLLCEVQNRGHLG